MSPGHDAWPAQLQARREGSRRIPPAEVYETLTHHRLDTPTKFFAFAARQHGKGDKSWVAMCMKMGTQKIKEAITTAFAVSGAEVALQRHAMTHLQILEDARDAPCICYGRAVPAWQEILRLNGMDEVAYCKSVAGKT